MSNNRLIFTILIGVVALMGSGVYLAAKLGTPANVRMNKDALLSVTETDKELGDISIDQDLVVTDFLIKNVGSESLALYNLTTSCMCTVVQVQIGDVISPEFKMGDRSTYVANVPPGEAATIKLIFDPAFHGPNGLGEVTRQAMMRTNDPREPKLVFTMSATVTR